MTHPVRLPCRSPVGATFFVAALSLAFTSTLQGAPPVVLIDDFSDPSGRASNGSRWSAFTDRVMGGVSDMQATREQEGDHAFLRMTGTVSLANNGGFVQVALPLVEGSASFDASTLRAVRLRVRGNGERYYLHLRTTDTRAPWQYYVASFPTTTEWAEVEVSLSSFEPAALRIPLDRSRLVRIALVAAGRAMQADLSVARVELVP